MQQFEKSVLGRSSRSRTKTTAAVREDDSEKDKGTDSEDEDDVPRKRPVSPFVFVASNLIYETRPD